jgi:cobalt-zinc-cadmium resistance protein CzcA
MIEQLVSFALRFRIIVFALAAGGVLGGHDAYTQIDIEAFPNPVPPLVEIITQPDGWSAEEVERYVTVPIEAEMNGTLGLDHIRSQSLFGLSDVKCYFTWDTDFYTAQQRIINRLQFLQLPQGLQPQLSPWNAIGEVFRYRVVGKDYSLTDLKTAQDWILEKQFRQVRGVIDVVGFGGTTKQYHVDVDPYRLRGQGITLKQVIDAISNGNKNVGGQRLIQGEQSFNIRGVGLIGSLNDIRDIVITAKAGVPLRVRDIGEVALGWAPRLGLVGKDADADVVQGIVLMRYGGNTIETLKGVHERVDYIRKYHLLPPGMDLEPYYDRGALVQVTTHTVLHNLVEGMLLVTVVLLLFLGDARSALVTAINIPLALLVAFIGMVSTGTPANLISLGAVDFGIVVDSTVIMMENCFRHLRMRQGGTAGARIIQAASEVGQPMFFSTLIIGVAFLPLFTLSGVEGVIFSPMAHTYAFAIGGAICLALTLTPLLASFLPVHHGAPHEPPHGTRHVEADGGAGGGDHDEHDDLLMRTVQRLYQPIFRTALRRPRTAIAIAAIPVLIVAALFPLLGKEFMPHLEEGSLWIRATLPMSISLDQSSKYGGRMRAVLKAHPEVTAVVSQLGRPDDGTDVSGFYNIELFAPLKPFDEWPRGLTKDKLTDSLSKQLSDEFPGVVFNFSQYIQDNVEEALSGVKGENTVKVIGPDLKVNEQKADEIVDVLAKVHGVTDLGMLRSLGQPNIKIIPNRAIAGRYGLNVGDVADVVQAAIGGQAVTQVFEGEKRFDLTVRFASAFRHDLRALRSILVNTPDGAVPLGQLAEVVTEEGPSVVFREDNRRYTPVKFSVRGRDLASTIGDAQHRIAEKVHLPYDTHLEWAGEINELKDATERLQIIVPITLLIIAFLVYGAVKTLKDTGIVLAGIPIACAGGVLALLATRTNFSVSAAMGFISIFGIAIQDALIVVTYAQRLWADGHGLEEGALLAATRRLRPVLMTTLVAMIGLLPAALSKGIGSETQKPLAIVVIGGALILAIVPRFLQPPLLVLAHRNDERNLSSH